MNRITNEEKEEYHALLQKLAAGFNPLPEPTTEAPQQTLEAELAELISMLRRDKAA